MVQGPWDDPLIFPDPESLIRRSPASAPLLDAVKDRKTRDAVRSVLERFTGGGQKAAAPEAVAAECAGCGCEAELRVIGFWMAARSSSIGFNTALLYLSVDT